MDAKDISRLIFKRFKSQGLSINGEAMKALQSVLSKQEDFETSILYILDSINKRIEKREVLSTLINVEVIQSVVCELDSTDDDIRNTSLQLLDAYSTPKLIFDEKQKSYKVIIKPTYSLHGGGVESRSQMYRERLLLTQQRLLRSGLFVMRGMGSSAGTMKAANNKGAGGGDVHELSTIESLLGDRGIKILFGMITQPEEGKLFLEDLNSSVRLDISSTKFSDNLLTEGCQVIVQGEYMDDVFRVHIMGTPPAEGRDGMLQSIGISDVFGNGMGSQQMSQSLELEESSIDTMFIIVSDIQIERPQVAEKLLQLFKGFVNTGINPLFVLMGNFVSKSATVSGGRESVNSAFSLLADIIGSCPDIAENSKFLIIPGNCDPGLNKVLPRRAIPDIFTKDLQKKVKNLTFGSNPCRLRFFTQEIVFFREDLLKKMQRHSIVASSSFEDNAEEDITERLVGSIANQAHLWPLPSNAKPIYWDLDYAMRLTPLPHLLVLGDQMDQFAHDIDNCDCKAVNPGSFSTDYSFIVYRPASKTVELSRIPP